MQYASFFAVWLLSSLILGAVHGASMGTFFGLAIATGYVVALRVPAIVARWRLHSRRRHQADPGSPAPNTYI